MTEQDRADTPAAESKYRAIDRSKNPPHIIMLQSADLIKYHPNHTLERRNADGIWERPTEQAPSQTQPE